MRPLTAGLQYTLLLILAGCAQTTSSEVRSGTVTPAIEVRPGIDVLVAGDMAGLSGMRVGLITNHTGKNRAGESTIDVLHRDQRIRLVALFAPEHGIRGAVEGGVAIETERDSKTGLPIYSLYGQTQKPTAEMLADLDVLVFDIQDIGTRYYTYPWTMALALRAAAEHNKRFVVLDRPNPIGGDIVQGNVNDTLTFVGLYKVPMRHGMTVGELAQMVNAEDKLRADLVVIPADGWRRSVWYDYTGLPWIAPSPNMQTLEAATHYPGTCLFEGTNLSVGRGTPIAFQQIGAPWLDNQSLIRRLDAYQFQGVRFQAVEFTPADPGDGKYDAQAVRGIKLVVTDRDLYDPTHVAMAALVEIRKLHKEQFEWAASFDRLVGNSRVKRQVDNLAPQADIIAGWAAQTDRFEVTRARYLIYK
jgi:uncharacterized protein YbbC (DUF1343 family)